MHHGPCCLPDCLTRRGEGQTVTSPLTFGFRGCDCHVPPFSLASGKVPCETPELCHPPARATHHQYASKHQQKGASIRLETSAERCRWTPRGPPRPWRWPPWPPWPAFRPQDPRRRRRRSRRPFHLLTHRNAAAARSAGATSKS